MNKSLLLALIFISQVYASTDKALSTEEMKALENQSLMLLKQYQFQKEIKGINIDQMSEQMNCLLIEGIKRKKAKNNDLLPNKNI